MIAGYVFANMYFVRAVGCRPYGVVSCGPVVPYGYILSGR